MRQCVDIVVGVQWGDEGKGKWIDIFSENADVVTRFQGGNNAGHTLVIEGKKLVLHQIPSGITRENRVCVLAAGVVISPQGLLKEIEALKEFGIEVKPENLKISLRAHIISPWQIKLDNDRCDWIGTTKKGIGPTYESKASRLGLRVNALLQKDGLDKWESKMAAEYKEFRSFTDCHEWREFRAACQKITPFLDDSEEFLRTSMKEGKKVLIEGAQGSLLDINHGSYPFVTSSSTVAGGALSAIGFSPKNVRTIFGICKAYQTRVGEGPMPTELSDEYGVMLAEKGVEFGATTGRPRRCGWLDLVALKYAVAINGVDQLILNKVDVLNTFEKILVCTEYDHPELGRSKTFYAEPDDLEKVKPIYKEFEGWNCEIGDTLPQTLKDFIKYISEYIEIPVTFIGTGVSRQDARELFSDDR